jgi:hypothetical protein
MHWLTLTLTDGKEIKVQLEQVLSMQWVPNENVTILQMAHPDYRLFVREKPEEILDRAGRGVVKR